MDANSTSPEDVQNLKQLLEQSLAVSQDNNRILRRMQRIGRIAFWAKVAVWAVVLIIPVLLIPYLSPLIKNLTSGSGNTLFGLPSPASVGNTVQQIKSPK